MGKTKVKKEDLRELIIDVVNNIDDIGALEYLLTFNTHMTRSCIPDDEFEKIIIKALSKGVRLYG